ncbi:phasin family protein [Oxalobacteraceae bacterium GrIS 1.11]
MFLFSFPRSSVTPAAKTHMEAQLSFFNDLSKSMFRSVQQFTDLNIQMAQTMLEESATAGHEMMSSHEPLDLFNATASRAQPTVGKIRAYQQHISRLAADSHVDLAKVAEEHVQETSRTAKALAEEVARVSNEETEKTMRKQQDTMQKFSDPFDRGSNGAQRRDARGAEMHGSASMQSAASQGGSEGMQGAASQSSMHSSQGGSAQSAAQSVNKSGATTRKE